MAKNYTIRVDLNNYEWLVYRVFKVNDNIKIRTLCSAILFSMYASLYSTTKLKYKNHKVKMGNNRLEELKLKKKDRLKLKYGDIWNFTIKVYKVSDGHEDKRISLLKGKSLGIIENCSSIKEFINMRYEVPGYDDIDIDLINATLDKYYNNC